MNIKNIITSAITLFLSLFLATPAYAHHSASHSRELLGIVNLEIFIVAMIVTVTIATAFTTHILFNKARK